MLKHVLSALGGAAAGVAIYRRLQAPAEAAAQDGAPSPPCSPDPTPPSGC